MESAKHAEKSASTELKAETSGGGSGQEVSDEASKVSVTMDDDEMEIHFSAYFQLAFNVKAAPFKPVKKLYDANTDKFIPVGPTGVPVNARIWDAIGSNRVFPELPRVPQHLALYSGIGSLQRVPSRPEAITPASVFGGFSGQQPFEEDRKRNALFTRSFGPVAHPEGFVEIRLREKIR